ncbi:hypothetical protein R6Q59_027427 [Mikania micrantha]
MNATKSMIGHAFGAAGDSTIAEVEGMKAVCHELARATKLPYFVLLCQLVSKCKMMPIKRHYCIVIITRAAKPTQKAIRVAAGLWGEDFALKSMSSV